MPLFQLSQEIRSTLRQILLLEQNREECFTDCSASRERRISKLRLSRSRIHGNRFEKLNKYDFFTFWPAPWIYINITYREYRSYFTSQVDLDSACLFISYFFYIFSRPHVTFGKKLIEEKLYYLTSSINWPSLHFDW